MSYRKHVVTPKKAADALVLRKEEGLSWRAIGEILDVNSNALRIYIKTYVSDFEKYQFCAVQNHKAMIYPNIDEWMQCNRCTYKGLSERAAALGTLIPTSAFGNQLRGEYKLKANVVNAILAITGMSYEEAFAK